MKITFLTTIMLLVVGCATYTKIDGKKWDDFEKKYKKWVISFKLPRGYIVDSPYNNEKHKGLGGYHYDVLEGTGIYGSAWGLTKLSLFVSNEDETDIKALIQSRLKNDLNTCIASSEENWDKITCEKPEKDYVTQFYIKQLSPNEFLYVVTRIRDAVYSRFKVRESRLKMLKDILETIEVTNA